MFFSRQNITSVSLDLLYGYMGDRTFSTVAMVPELVLLMGSKGEEETGRCFKHQKGAVIKAAQGRESRSMKTGGAGDIESA